MIVLDLCCGLGGFGQAFRDRGHKVYGLDIVPPAEVIADARALPFKDGCRPDALLASPPCTEFTREDLPKTRHKRDPGRCYVKAGWTRLKETTKGGLVVLQLKPEDVGPGAAPHGVALNLWEVA